MGDLSSLSVITPLLWYNRVCWCAADYSVFVYLVPFFEILQKDYREEENVSLKGFEREKSM